MHFNRTSFAALACFGIALFGGRARAQSTYSTAQGRTPIEVANADKSTRLATTTIRLRCSSAISASSPLFVIDGKIAEEQDVKSINPNDIDKVEILKSTAATGAYGSRAANGAVLITMKHRNSKYIYRPEQEKSRLD